MKKNKLCLLTFINSHKNWEDLLKAPPYNLLVKHKNEYILLKYNQISSDFKQQMVREARGLILKKVQKKYVVVCMPFTKFFALEDPNAKLSLNKIYKKKCWCLEQKIDGSLIKIWWDKEWHISTNGTIDAEDADVTTCDGEILNNYKSLFLQASQDKINYDLLDKTYTYMFELVSIDNKVVVSYKEPDVYYLGRRSIINFCETPYEKDDCKGVERCKRPGYEKIYVFQKPKQMMKQIKEKANNLTQNDEHFEGFVLSDMSLKTRVKIKSRKYLELAAKKGNGTLTSKKILLMILNSQDDDLLAMFPEYQKQFSIIKENFNLWLKNIMKDLEYIQNNKWQDKKSFAEWAVKSTNSFISFSAYGQDNINDDWLLKMIKRINIDKLIEYIEVKNNV